MYDQYRSIRIGMLGSVVIDFSTSDVKQDITS